MKAHTQRAIYDVAISDCPKITEGTIDETLYGGQLCENKPTFNQQIQKINRKPVAIYNTPQQT